MNDTLRNSKIPNAVHAISIEIQNQVYEMVRFESHVTQREIQEELLHQLAAHYGKLLKE